MTAQELYDRLPPGTRFRWRTDRDNGGPVFQKTARPGIAVDTYTNRECNLGYLLSLYAAYWLVILCPGETVRKTVWGPVRVGSTADVYLLLPVGGRFRFNSEPGVVWVKAAGNSTDPLAKTRGSTLFPTRNVNATDRRHGITVLTED